MTIHARILAPLAAIALAGLSLSGAFAQDASPVASPEASPVAAADCATLLGIGTADDGCLILINGIPDSDKLDLYVDGLMAVEGLTFADVSGYFALPAGTYDLALAPPATSVDEAIVTLDGVDVAAGQALELAAVGKSDSADLLVSPVDLSPLPPGTEGTPLKKTRIRAIHAIPDGPSMHLSLLGGDIAERTFPNLAFSQVSDYVVKTAGIYRVILNANEGELASVNLDEVFFQGDTVYSLYALGDVANDDLRLLVVAIDLKTGVATARAIPPKLVSEIVNVSNFALYEGSCDQLSGQVAFELSGTGYDAAGPGTIAPWGADADPQGALGAVPVLYGEGEIAGANLGDLLGGRTVSLVVHDANTGGVIACGEIGGVVEQADHFWQHDRLIVGIEPLGDSGLFGTATFTEDTGILNDKIIVSVSLVTTSEEAES